MINNGFGGLFWYGVVEDINDPDKLGRVKVRHVLAEVDNKNSKDYVATENLPWATVLTPSTSSGQFGLGQSPTGLKKGSRVMCFCMDYPEKNLRYVLGSIPHKDEDASSHSVSKLARGEFKDNDAKLGPEPKSSYKAQYPYNSTIQTESGHVIEMDDTPKHERIHVRHRSGSYVEMRPNGAIVSRTVGDNLDIIQETKVLYSANGRIDIITQSDDINIVGKGNITIKADGDIVIQGNTVSISSMSNKGKPKLGFLK